MQVDDISYHNDIQNSLINSDVEDYGLFNGEAGRAILLFLLLRSTGNKLYEKKALQGLDEIGENIASIEILGFENGLAGIGWTVEWIAQNGFLEMNTNEVLEDIDDTLYKSVVYSTDKNISLAEGTLGKFLFFWNRYKSRNPGTHRLKAIFHEECLVLLTDDLHEKLCGETGILLKDNLSNEDLINLGHTFYFICDFIRLKVNEPTVETILYESVTKIIDDLLKIEEEKSFNTEKLPYYEFLVTCFYFGSKQYQQRDWERQAKYFLKLFRKYKVPVKEHTYLAAINEITYHAIFQEPLTNNTNYLLKVLQFVVLIFYS